MVSISASSFEFSELWKLEEAAQQLKMKEVGIELFCDAMGFGETRFLKDMFQGISMGMHCPAKDIDLLAEKNSLIYRYTMSRMESTLQSCRELGCAYMVLHTNVTAQPLTGDLDTLRERGLERISALAKLAAQYGVKIWVENVGTVYRNTLLYNFDQYLDIFTQLPQVDALIDVGHAFINNWNIPKMIGLLGNRLQGMHMHDNFGVRDVHIRIGSGKLNFSELMSAVCKLEQEPNMIVEYLMPSCDSVEAAMEDCMRIRGWMLR